MYYVETALLKNSSIDTAVCIKHGVFFNGWQADSHSVTQLSNLTMLLGSSLANLVI